ncbi:MAG: hypothetical protein ACLQVY_09460 [Limisphaerales bacterium]
MKKHQQSKSIIKPTASKAWRHSGLACLILTASFGISQATELSFDPFNNAAQVSSFAYQNWNGTVAATNIWAADDSQGLPNSGSMKIVLGLSKTTMGGAFVDSITSADYSQYTALEFDIKVDAASGADQYGAALELKPGVGTAASGYNAADMNIYPVMTNDGWQHVVIPAATIGGGPSGDWSHLDEVFFQCQDYNETNAVTAIFYIDNIQFTTSGLNYPNYTNATFQFDDPSTVAAIVTSWYGNSPNTVMWSTNDSQGYTNSGSLYITAAFANGNNIILGIPFDTNWTGFETDTNYIDARHYSAIEMDVLWDTNTSTIDLGTFNSAGDVSGFPVGAVANPGAKQDEICGTATTVIPLAASNSWQHIVCPITAASLSDAQMIGLWFKKYYGGTDSGTVAFWIDNITFDGAVVPVNANVPTLGISKVVPGLQCNFTGTGGNPPYSRLQLVTAATSYSFVDVSSPVTYSMTIGYAPPSSNSSVAEFTLDPGATGTGQNTEPDWTDPTVMKITISHTAAGSQVQLQCKTNSATSNGDLYDASNPTWTNSSSPVGIWSFTISRNTNILCVAPNGSSTNMPFPPMSQTVMTSADVESNFPASGGMYVYVGAQGGSATCEGTRWVIDSVSISGGGVTPLSENFVAEANAGDPGPTDQAAWTPIISGVNWYDAADASNVKGLYLLSTNTPYFVDWTANAGSGFTVLTNTVLGATGWGTNTDLTANAYLNANYFRTEVSTNDLPPSGSNWYAEIVK